MTRRRSAVVREFYERFFAAIKLLGRDTSRRAASFRRARVTQLKPWKFTALGVAATTQHDDFFAVTPLVHTVLILFLRHESRGCHDVYC